MIDRFKLLYDAGNAESLSKNPTLTPEQIDLLYLNKMDFIKKNLARYPKLTEEQFVRFFNDTDFDEDFLARNPNLTPEQIDLLYDAGANKEYLAEYSKLTEEQFMRFFNDEFLNNYYLAPNPSINAPAKQPFVSGIFNWKW